MKVGRHAEEWIREFNELGVDIMENETSMFQTVKGDVCIRGLGDKYTDRYSYVDYPEECENIPKFTITHDPAGAFNAHVKGLVVAGHTHCGQISLPFIGPYGFRLMPHLTLTVDFMKMTKEQYL
jgi:predicted MPP superfamily phosphohydrolase